MGFLKLLCLLFLAADVPAQYTKAGDTLKGGTVGDSEGPKSVLFAKRFERNAEVPKCETPPSPKAARVTCRSGIYGMECTARCKRGYSYPSGGRSVTLSCDSSTGVWSPQDTFPDCEAVCDPVCENGGECYGNNQCVCALGFRGDRCQYSVTLCDTRKHGFTGNWLCNHTHVETVCAVECQTGLHFESPPLDSYRCSLEGIWHPPTVPDCIPEGVIPGPGGLTTEVPPLPVTRPPEELIKPTGVCTIWGRFHVKTFDGTMYRFPGACSYTLLEDCSRTVAYRLVMHYSRGCPDARNCTRSIEMVIGDQRLHLTFGRDLPANLEAAVMDIPGLTMQWAGKYLVFRSTVGFTIWFDRFSAQIKLSQALQQNACGLCGNFDGDASNDLVALGTRMTPRNFAVYWIAERDCMDKETVRDACEAPAGSGSLIDTGAFDRCSVLFHEVFADCHQVLPAKRFFDACKQECCDQRTERCECSTLDEYFRECQRLGVKMDVPWRQHTTCPHACSNGTVYSECGPACRISCANRDPACPVGECAAGCHCPPGTLWQDNACVAPGQCKCTYRGREYDMGEEVVQDCNTCICNEGLWECSKEICDAQCVLLPSSTYNTFDGHHYQAGGQCSYMLVDTDNYEVVQDKRSCASLDSVCIGEIVVNLKFEAIRVKLTQELGVLLNEREVPTTPAVFPGMTVSKPTPSLAEITLEGLTILTDGKTQAVLTAKEAIFARTRGLCGTFNHKAQDDFETETGEIDQDADSFAESWAQALCLLGRLERVTCDKESPEWELKTRLCNKIYEPTFAECHDVVPPEPLVKICSDVGCSCTSVTPACLCPVLQHYAFSCAQKGRPINWRPDVPECPVLCGGGQTYRTCPSLCESSCQRISLNTTCTERCLEGCACPEGLTMSRQGHCIPIAECGCVSQGTEYPVGYKQKKEGQECECIAAKWHCRGTGGELIVTPPPVPCSETEEYTDCQPSCPETCKSVSAHLGRRMDLETCEKGVCRPGCQCKAGFVRDDLSGECIPHKSCPCTYGNRVYKGGDKAVIKCEECTCDAGTFLCAGIDCGATCSVWGDSHVRTFDDVTYDFQGFCDYTLVRGQAANDSFAVIVQNTHCGSQASCAKTIIITYGVETVTLTKSFPTPSTSPNSRITIGTSGLFVTAHVRNGITIYWDRHSRVYVVAQPLWHDKVEGLCGNYNKDDKDDFMGPSGGPPLPNAEEFVTSWQLYDYCTAVRPGRKECKPERRHWANDKCHVLLEDTFAECRRVVDVWPFHERCVSDSCQCDLGGDCDCLCTAIATYAHECANQGVHVLWRNQDLCPIQCELCDEYTACVSDCPPPTCEQPIQEKCPEPAVCLEGCQPAACPLGQVRRNLTDYSCVPLAECGKKVCVVGGAVYTDGERIPDPDPCRSCFCQLGEVNCLGAPCAKEPYCGTTGWTDWASVTTPVENEGHEEEAIEAHLAVCSEDYITAVECRTVQGKVPWDQTGEVVSCDASVGLTCYADQNTQPCSDYEIRVFCNCSVCPEGTTWNKCSTRCNTTCQSYLRELQREGKCQAEVNECVPGCVKEDCAPGTFRFDGNICVQPYSCPCVSEDGKIIPPGETYQRGCDMCQCAHNKISCTTLQDCVRPSTVAPPVPWTPASGECWTEWISLDVPDGPGDFEDIRALQVGGTVCSSPVAIECRTVSGNVDWKDAGQKMVCDLEKGLECWNKDNPETSCNDYEVRFYCPCKEVVTTPTAPPVTVVPCTHGWTQWFNLHVPDHSGDLETLQDARDSGGLLCDSVVAIQCRVVGTHETPKELGLPGVVCDLQRGLICVNEGLPVGRTCPDFEVQFFCDCGALPTPPPEEITAPTEVITVATTLFPCSYWSEWIDNSHPDAVGVTGERELGIDLQEELRGFCQGYVTDVECRETLRDIPYNRTGQANLVCNVHEGFSCKHDDQSPGECLDYKIRFFCACEEGTTTTVVVTPTPQPTGVPPCNTFIYLIDGPEPVPDSSLKASSSTSAESGPQAARYRSEIGWSPIISNEDQFIEVELDAPKAIYGIETQGSELKNQWVTAYSVMYSVDGVIHNYVRDAYGNVKVFSGNHDSTTRNRHVFQVPFEAKFIRILPKSWERGISLKFDLLGCSAVIVTATPPTPSPLKRCGEEMGLENGLIRDDQLTASSEQDPLHAAQHGRIGSHAWVPAVADTSQYIQVDFGVPVNLTAVTTVGRPDVPQWVKSYKVQHSLLGNTWTTIPDQDGSDMVFSGNYDNVSPVTNVFLRAVQARFLRIVPVTWNNWIAVQFEVLGCRPEIGTTLVPPPEYECPDRDGLFPDPYDCGNYYLCENGLYYKESCGTGMHFNPREKICDVPEIAGCEATTTPVVPVTTPSCIVKGPWISTLVPTPESEGDIESIRDVIDRTGLCKDPIAIECREYSSDADYTTTGQQVTCDLTRGLRCLNKDQKSGLCLNYKVRITCYTCEVPSTVVPPPAVHLCPEVPSTEAVNCPESCPLGYACNGTKCVDVAMCPCVREGKMFQVGDVLLTTTCQQCLCQIDGRSSCEPKQCDPCPRGRSQTFTKNCSCTCAPCPEGTKLCITSGECIPSSKWCDGIEDCLDDEKDCELPPATCAPLVVVECPEGQTAVLVTTSGECQEYICEVTPPPTLPPPPPGNKTCVVVGIRFKTLDGKEYYYSYCDHILVQGGGFTVSITRRCTIGAGGNVTTCSKILTIKHDFYLIKISDDITVTVNGYVYDASQLDVLYEFNKDFRVEILGDQVYFTSHKYGIVVRIDVRGKVVIEVSDELREKIAGLCGTLNDNPTDDFTTPDGIVVVTTEDFGTSWIVPGSHEECVTYECPREYAVKAAEICNRMRNEFKRHCTDIGERLTNCLSATCECLQGPKSDNECVCDAFLSTITECESDKGLMFEWRTKYGCVSECRPPLVWQECGPDCQFTCQSLVNGMAHCDTPRKCNPGCYCPPGTVLDRQTCRRADQCGDEVCYGYGDPMIKTFDGISYPISANGVFKLVSDRHGLFDVQVVVADCPGRINCIAGVNLLYKGHVVSVLRERPLKIDGTEPTAAEIPWNRDGISVQVVPGPTTIVTVSEVGIQIRYSEISAAFEVRGSTKSLFNRVVGLCGNSNGNQNDEGIDDVDIDEFVCSWDTRLELHDCLDNVVEKEVIRPPPPKACEELKDKEVFQNCASLVTVDSYIQQCLRDASVTVEYKNAVCDSMIMYARACCEVDIRIQDVFSRTGCNVSCSGGAVYHLCHSSCPQTCTELSRPGREIEGSSLADCATNFVDGCFCPEGQVIVDGVCTNESVCEICDDEGHRVGDTWIPDPCTTCVCTAGKRVDCKTEPCQPDPICGPDERIDRLPGATQGQCCDIVRCVPKPTEPCPETGLPRCEPGEITKLKEENGCPIYYCECDQWKCPQIQWPADLEPGQVVTTVSEGCCAHIKIECDPESCPPEPVCPPGMEMASIEGTCCLISKCEPPPAVCVYTHLFEVVDGRELPVLEQDQSVTTYPVATSWKDGLCRNCTCEPRGLQYVARCVEQTCLDNEDLPDDKDYVLELVPVPGRCCPMVVREFCKDEYGSIREPGTTWPSRKDRCKTHVCEKTALGELHKVVREVSCPACPENTQKIPPLPGECCPTCRETSCEENGVSYPAGSKWNSTARPCFVAECVRQDNELRTVYTSPPCAPLTPGCPPEEIVLTEDGCCKVCKIALDLCDEYGHKVGDQWQRDLCTTCACLVGGKVDCTSTQCPPEPICLDSEKLDRVPGAARNQCCDTVRCVEKPPELCPVVPMPQCKPGEVAKVREEHNCPVYYCECDPRLCPEVVWPTELEPGQDIRQLEDDCCVTLEIVCKPELCPVEPVCPPLTELVTIQGTCCAIYKCRLPPEVCLYTHLFNVVRGKEVPIPVQDQVETTYRVATSWKDGLCRNCTCEPSGLQYVAECVEETCFETKDLPDDEDYILVPVEVPGKCCPSVERRYCKDEYGNVRQPGEKWPSTEDPCKSNVCEQTEEGIAHKLLREVFCSPCAQNMLEIAPLPGECCPSCRATVCEENGVVYPEGSKWNSTTRDCSIAECVRYLDELRIIYTTPPCPEVPAVCPQSQIVWSQEQCCDVCRVEICDEEGHQVGDSWKRDPCTTCSCLEGRTVDCKTEVCPPDPICAPNEKLERLSGAARNQCCDIVRCVPKPTIPCPDVPAPDCKAGEVAKVREENNCPVYYCECDPVLCPELVWPAELEPGQDVELVTDGCCASLNLVCTLHRCPVQPVCAPGTQLLTIQGTCCTIYKCKPPTEACVYTHLFKVVDGKDVLVPVQDQAVSIYPAGMTWRDGLCRNCTCEPSGLEHVVRCSAETCVDKIDKDYVLQPVPVSGQCCPKLEPVLCKDETGNARKPGETWRSRADPCKTITCLMTLQGVLNKVIKAVTCPECPKNMEAIAPLPGECCASCRDTVCEEDGVFYPEGSKWNSTARPCNIGECVRQLDELRITYTTPTCPPIPANCPQDQVVWSAEECCMVCKIEVCDELGHQVGDTWLRDPCTTCTCLVDGKVNCTTTQCPPDPICGPDERLKREPGSTKGQCCDIVRCVPKAPTPCPLVPMPECKPGEVAKVRDENDCPVYYCECDPLLCPEVKWPSKLEPGQEVNIVTTECCPSLEIVCKLELCPVRPTCPPGTGMVTVEGTCCSVYKCKPPAEVCLYSHLFEVIDGKEVPIRVQDQTLVTYPLDTSWKDGLCRICTCESNGLQYAARCTEETCFDKGDVADDKDYVLQPIPVPNKCCPTLQRIFCKDEYGNVRQPGTTWTSKEDPCKTVTCEKTAQGVVSKVIQGVTCPQCPKNMEVQPPPAGECCPTCLETACEENGVLYPEGAKWNSTAMHCHVAECVRQLNELRIVYKTPQCPPVPPECPLVQVVLGEDLCCLVCKVEVCDDEGHVVGNSWKPDPCTTCVCAEGRKVDCRTKQCPSPPICKPNEKLERISGAARGQCCDTVRCVLKPPEPCPPVNVPDCKRGEVAKVREEDGCPVYYCECDPVLCPLIQWPTDLEPGQEVDMVTEECCASLRILCKPELCPAEPVCPPGTDMVTVEGECCRISKCKPPPEACLYSHVFDVVDGKEVPVSVQDQTVTTYPVGQTWRDGLCRNCTCEANGLAYVARCTEETCRDRVSLPNDKDYVLQPVPVPGACCPSLQPLLCRDDYGNTREPGSSWPSREDPCKTHTCERTSEGLANKVTRGITCPACPKNLEVMPPLPGECCPTCKETACEEDGVLYPEGSKWNSTARPCSIAECVRQLDELRIIYTKPPCNPLPLNCPLDQVVWSEEECCTVCKVDICDKEGHVVGDVWARDACTTCTCLIGGKVDCTTTQCPPEPICGPDEKLERLSGTLKGQCCDIVRCVPKPPAPCPDVLMPDCKPGEVAKVREDNGCPVYYCECDPALCPQVKWPTELEPGQDVNLVKTECCTRLELTCRPELCPAERACDPGTELVVIQGACCTIRKCRPPPEVCLYSHLYKVVGGKEVPVPVQEQTVKTYSLGTTWKDGLCRNCTCEINDLAYMARCVEEMCLNRDDLPDDKDYILQPVPVPGRCCPSLERVFCKDESGNIREPGSTWTSKRDPCKQYVCERTTLGLVNKLTRDVSCPSCPKNMEAIPALPGECCPSCRETACEENGVLYPEGSEWNSTSRLCHIAECVRQLDGLSIMYTAPPCPPVAPNCPLNQIVMDARGCCKVCKVEICDNQGHVVGDRWIRDPCTTCVCTEGRKVDCTTEKCPPEPICGPDEKLERVPGATKGQCCDIARCVPKPPEPCPVVPMPDCKPGEAAKVRQENDCPVYYCECDTALCPDVVWPAELEPGQVVEAITTECCNTLRIKCEPELCPVAPTCPLHTEVVTVQGPCCTIHKCKPPPEVCLYSHLFEVVDGKEVPILLQDQTVTTYPVATTWRDGLCRNCTCEPNGLAYMARCVEETCFDKNDLPDDKDYILQPVLVPGKCCPILVRQYCKDELGNVREPGAKWPSWEDPCKTHLCEQTEQGVAHKLVREVTCPKCPQGTEELPPLRGECCPSCRETACEENGVLYPEGSKWNSTLRNCHIAECVRELNQLRIIYTAPPCTPLPVNCPPDQVVWTEDSCCTVCKVDICDEQGHVVGDTWPRDPCTTCACLMGGKVDCTTTQCPPEPICGPDEKLDRLPGANIGQCCDVVRCVPKPPVLCPDVLMPACKRGEVAKVREENGCPLYYCECDPILCPLIEWPADLEPGQDVEVFKDDCCASMKLVCRPELCPVQPVCLPGMELVTLQGTCCATYKCKPPPEVCLYSHLFEVVDGREVPILVQDQTVTTYPLDTSWKDGLCRNCTCEIDGLAYMARCVEETCFDTADLPDDKEYVLQPVHVPGRCCPVPERRFCKDEYGNIREPGATWPSREDPCRTHICEHTPQGLLNKVIQGITCQKCPKDTQEVPPVPGECCPTCRQVACEENGVLYPQGSKWNSTSRPCHIAECVRQVNELRITYTTPTCPPIPLTCPLNKVVWSQAKCCMVCLVEICDEQGHQVGDTWRRDPCTTCQCLEGLRVSCQTDKCPPEPICLETEKLERLPGALNGQCCDTVRCVPKPPEPCPDVLMPDCKSGEVAKVREENGCPVYYCECDPVLCPDVLWPTQLEPGQAVELVTEECCATLRLNCTLEPCPVEPVCAPDTELVTIQGACCTMYKCRPPPEVCLYTHLFEVVDGREVPVLVQQQTAVTYPPGMTWKDGLCRNCTCEVNGLAYTARCVEETCFDREGLPDDEDYVLQPVVVPGRCCPVLERQFCKDEFGNTREPGAKWPSTEDPCKSHVCEQTPQGVAHKLFREVICPTCPENMEEVAPAPGECCPACRQTACEEGGVLYPEGSKWNSTIRRCYVAECVRHLDQLRIIYTSPECQPVATYCPADQVIWSDDKCCMVCLIEICDKQGHQVGDTWKPHPCTTCSCAEGRAVDCKTDVCPPDPICPEDQKLERQPGALKDQCCDTVRCIPKRPEPCPEVPLPSCEPGEVIKVRDEDGCPVYFCECDPLLCPEAKWPTELEPGQDVEVVPTACCLTLRIVCNLELCPVEAVCAPGTEMATTQGRCCALYKCTPPREVCLYTHLFEVVDGSEVPVPVADQIATTYPVDTTWKDGLCRNCTCEASGLQYVARCVEETCFDTEDIPESKDYVLTPVPVPGRCCPTVARLFCKDEEGYAREPGESWPSKDDPCKTHVCKKTPLGEVDKMVREVTCPNCPQNTGVINPEPGECCPTCRDTACEEDGVPYPQGSRWNSTTRPCYEAECVRLLEGLRIIYTSPPCPPVPDACPKDQVVWTEDKCCMICNVTVVPEETCAPLPIPLDESLGVFTYEDGSRGLCVNEQPVPTALECGGTCQSYAIFRSGESDTFKPLCKCCTPTSWRPEVIVLTCPNGDTISKSFNQPTACECKPCLGEKVIFPPGVEVVPEYEVVPGGPELDKIKEGGGRIPGQLPGQIPQGGLPGGGLGTGQTPGQLPTGQMPGQLPTGQMPGQLPTGQMPGQLPTGQMPGQLPTGQMPGQLQTGQMPGQLQTGQMPGQLQTGQMPGQLQTGQMPGQLPTGQMPGQLPTGQMPGQLPTGKLPGQLPTGQMPWQLPTGHMSGQLPAAQMPWQLPTGQVSGQLPAAQMPGQLSAEGGGSAGGTGNRLPWLGGQHPTVHGGM